jgi:hypothetical protein
MPQESDTQIADWFQKAFKLFGIDRRNQTFDQLEGSIDGVLLLNVRWMAGDRLMLHENKMRPHLFNNLRTKLPKAPKQRRKDNVGKV